MRTIQRKTQGKFSHSLDNFKRDIDHHFTQEIASLSMQVPNTLGFSHRAPIENNCAIKHGSSVYPKYGQGPTYAGSSYNEMDTGINKDLFEVCYYIISIIFTISSVCCILQTILLYNNSYQFNNQHHINIFFIKTSSILIYFHTPHNNKYKYYFIYTFFRTVHRILLIIYFKNMQINR